MGFTIYFALVAVANIFLGYFLATRLGLVVPAVANAAESPENESRWGGKERETDAEEDSSEQ